MVDSGSATTSARRYLNPWVLHLQKLGLELKCPLCLNLFDKPMLLPCDHIFCKPCLDLTVNELECSICYAVCLNSAIRPSPHTENLVSVYRNMDMTLSTVQQPSNSGVGTCLAFAALEQCTSVGMHERICGSTNTKSKDGNSQGNIISYGVQSGEVENFEKGSTTMREADTYREKGNQATGTNLVLYSAPDSPPSLGCPRVDDDSTDQGSEHSIQRDRMTSYLKDKSQNSSLHPTRDSQELQSHGREPKKQKTVRGDFSVSGTKSTNQQEADSSSPKSNVGHKLSLQTNILHKTIKCAFCQSSKVVQKTGPMLHYSPDGVPVNGDDIYHPSIIHVHEICINWAPKVYFKGDIVQDLKKEVARGAKLKCSKCRLKGAVLGCFETTCNKSFHVTCAMEISECKWNLDDFLLFCPSHASLSFPLEEPRKAKINPIKDAVPLPSELLKDTSNLWVTSKTGSKPWLLCGSALTNDEKSLMMKLSTKYGLRVTKYWQPDVTHVIASTDANGACCRTLKVLMGISYGIWILKADWIRACLDAKRPVDEEPYEMCIDNHGCMDGPKTGRLRALSDGPKIFAGLQFYFSGYFIPGFKRDLNSLLTAAGGIILSSAQELTAGMQGHQTVVVYNLDPLNEDDTSDPGQLVQQRREEALNLLERVGDIVVAHTWLLESIAACKLLPWIM